MSIQSKSDKRGFSFGSFLIGLLLGATAGAAVGILMAPKSGNETREVLKNKLQQGRQQASKASGESTSQLQDLANDGKASIGAKLGLIRQAFEAGKQAAKEKHQQLNAIEDIGRKDFPNG